MVNGYDVASKGQAISELGWDLQKVRQSVAMELPVDQAKRQTIVKANLTLAEQSDGILCRPFGQERFCFLSSSHTTCFLRSLEAGCEVMPGKASVEQLVAKGDDLGKMMFQGWQWTIISCKVDEEVPNLATMLQQAYNSHWYTPTNFHVFLKALEFWDVLPAIQVCAPIQLKL